MGDRPIVDRPLTATMCLQGTSPNCGAKELLTTTSVRTPDPARSRLTVYHYW